MQQAQSGSSGTGVYGPISSERLVALPPPRYDPPDNCMEESKCDNCRGLRYHPPCGLGGCAKCTKYYPSYHPSQENAPR